MQHADLAGEAASSVHTFSGSLAQMRLWRAALAGATAMVGAPDVCSMRELALRPCAHCSPPWWT